MPKAVVVIPNWNGGSELIEAVDSLAHQTVTAHIIVVDNASTDGSAEVMAEKHPEVEIIKHSTNKGYAGGVNPGFRRAIELGATYTAPFNDDAVADARWLEKLISFLDDNESYGAACCKVLKQDGQTMDSTGEFITNWGLSFPRGRGEKDTGQYDESPEIMAASGAASLFRVAALKEVGLLDEDFFAYYEDVDLGFRLQLGGWKVSYVPSSIVYHKIGMTSGRIKGFTTLQTMKNLPLLWWKNMPRKYLFRTGWRLRLALFLFWCRAVSRGQFVPATKGALLSCKLIWKKRGERKQIQATRKLSDQEVWALLTHDLPPNATALRKLRAFWWKVTFRNVG